MAKIPANFKKYQKEKQKSLASPKDRKKQKEKGSSKGKPF